jgi:hypothetical protein
VTTGQEIRSSLLLEALNLINSPEYIILRNPTSTQPQKTSQNLE